MSATSKTWLVRDVEVDKVFRFYYPTVDPKTALKAYLQHGSRSLSTPLTPEELDEAVDNFEGEIWSEGDIQDLSIFSSPRL